MSTVVLADAPAGHPSLTALSLALQVELAREGRAQVRTFDLSTLKLAFCQGEFDCWVRTPGRCRAEDAESDIVAAIHDADALVLLDAVTFGGHGYRLKRAQDRLICLLTPFFEKRSALTHHAPRYEHPASLYALGWLGAPDAEQTETWRALADANAVNMLAPRVGAAVVDDAHPGDWPAAIRAMLASPSEPGSSLHERASLRAALVEAARPGAKPPFPGGPDSGLRAAFLIGSAKPKGTSASETMARALASRLALQGIASEFHFATEFVRDDAIAVEAARAIAAADLFVLATPLYVDALPALATHALELVAREREAWASARFVPIINCGFPEPEHIRTALRIARCFADAAGYHYAGALALGGGGTVAPDTSLDDPHGPVVHVARALELAAQALSRGGVVPAEAQDEMMKSQMPDALYRMVGDLGFRYRAHQLGIKQSELRARPLAER